MAEYREERVTTERTVDDPVVVDRAVTTDRVASRGNPAPVIAAICIGLLILFLVLFGMSRNNGDGDSNDGGVNITVPDAVDGNDDSGSGSGTNDSGSGTNDSGTKDSGADAGADAGTSGTTAKP